MENKNITAIAKLVKKARLETARNDLSVGVHNVDFTVHIQGELTVLADTTKKPTVSIPLKETLALFIHYCGITREAAILVLTRAMTEALSDGTKGKGALLHLPAVVETMDRVENEILANLPETPVKGSVLTDLTFTEVEQTVTA